MDKKENIGKPFINEIVKGEKMLKNNGYEFVEETKYPNISPPDQNQDKPQPSYEIPVEPGMQRKALPDPNSIDFGHYDLRQAIEERRSLRRYSEDSLSLAELSYLLWLTQGIKKVDEKRHVVWRTVPSAGCRHPFETYLSINRVEGLDPGLYRYIASENQLEVMRINEDFNEKLTDACLGQRQVATSAVTFIWAAVPYRTVWRYSERSYRYLYLDAGHVCQNLHLAAESINCGICAIGAYDDDAADALMGFNPPEMFVIYMASLGKRE
jgi:SagB-type dehydrogenase family enzyme